MREGYGKYPRGYPRRTCRGAVWAWGALFASTYFTGGWEPGWAGPMARLREGPLPATELAAEVGMERSACSHQLRLLRNLGLVTGTCPGRSVMYALYDDHVAELLDQALYHVEHLQLGLSDAVPAVAASGTGAAPIAEPTRARLVHRRAGGRLRR